MSIARDKENMEIAAARNFGNENIDEFYQSQAPQLWSMIVRTNNLMENQAAKTEEVLAAARQTNAAVSQFLQQAQQMQDAAFWKGKYYENTEEFNKLYGYLEKIGERLHNIEKQQAQKSNR